MLVIERKSISWPPDYPRRHSNDHLVSELFSEALADLPFEHLYELRLPMLIQCRQREVKHLVDEAANEIRAHWRKAQNEPFFGSSETVNGGGRFLGSPNGIGSTRLLQRD